MCTLLAALRQYCGADRLAMAKQAPLNFDSHLFSQVSHIPHSHRSSSHKADFLMSASRHTVIRNLGKVTALYLKLPTHSLLCMQALRQHCNASGHDPSRNPKPAKLKGSPSATASVPLVLSVTPEADHVEMDRSGLTLMHADLQCLCCAVLCLCLCYTILHRVIPHHHVTDCTVLYHPTNQQKP